MLLVGMNSWTQASTGTAVPPSAPSARQTRARSGALRAGIASALIALTLMVGFGRPAETAAYKSNSLVCTTLEAGFNYAGDMYITTVKAYEKNTTAWAAVAKELGASAELVAKHTKLSQIVSAETKALSN